MMKSEPQPQDNLANLQLIAQKSSLLEHNSEEQKSITLKCIQCTYLKDVVREQLKENSESSSVISYLEKQNIKSWNEIRILKKEIEQLKLKNGDAPESIKLGSEDFNEVHSS